MGHAPMREGGRFAIESHSTAKLLGSGFRYTLEKVKIVYADNDEPSHCVWMVPGTWGGSNG